ncbi:MAG: hypothetical protein ACYC21_08100 [Eubacteriales bacterium]
MIKKKIFIILGTMILLVGLLVAISSVVFSKSPYSDREFEIQKSVVDTFDLKGQDFKPLFMEDIYDDKIAKESPETRAKVADAVYLLKKDNELVVGDLIPMIFLKGNDKVLIGVKHPNNTITLTEFDISKEQPVKGNKQVKEAK